MYTDILNIFIAFFEGLALIISPCILPILPIILAGSLTGQKRRPLGIITGFILMFTIITLFSRTLIQILPVSEDMLRYISYLILFLLGLIMISPYLSEKFNLLTQRLTSVGSSWQVANNPQSGFWGGVIFGGLVGIIWTPCAGPILATVIVQVVLQKTTTASILMVISFAIGAGLPMLVIALIGRKIMSAFNFFRARAGLFRQGLGLIIMLTIIYLVIFAATAPSFSQMKATPTPTSTSLINALEKPYRAPEIAGIEAWINSKPLQWNDLKGKVVLIDFWTYSCINCIRTLPYIKDWYTKYHDKGLVIIGVHSPEFQFEHDLNNVKNAVIKNGILYPVALDNQFTTWQNFHNQYWPAHYLINQNGEVVFVHFGEGEYDVTENNIQYLLGLRESVTAKKTKQSSNGLQTPETYLGYARSENFSSPEAILQNQPKHYTSPEELKTDKWALNGAWIIYADKIVAANKGASITLHFFARHVYAVMGAKVRPVNVKLILNGQAVTNVKGQDVDDSQVNVSAQQLYSLIQLNESGEGTLQLIAGDTGLEIYTFTFGS